MSAPISRLSRSERGAILVHAAAMLLVLVGCTALVVDYGMQLVGRNQAQAAADSAALGAAGALALGTGCSTADIATARETALTTATENLVWGQKPALTLADVTTPTCPDGRANCVQVRLYRDGAHGNPLPTTFAQILGTSAVDVSATAVAEWLPANVTDCIRPWAVPDRWTEGNGDPWTSSETFSKGNDGYTAPTAGGAGTGLTVGSFCGAQVTLTRADLRKEIRPWQFVTLKLSRIDELSGYARNVTSCNLLHTAIADGVKAEPEHGVVPVETADVSSSMRQAITELIAMDPAATWNVAQKKVTGGCMAATGESACALSPRIVAMALFDPLIYDTDRIAKNLTTVTVRNIVGFFISRLSGSDVEGYLTLYPGLGTNSPRIGANAAFLRTSVLVK